MSTKRAPKPARGKTTPASTAGSFTTYAHSVADINLGSPQVTIDVDDVSALAQQMAQVEGLVGYRPDMPHPAPEIEHRDDMPPLAALWECYDLWASGAWDDRNAKFNLEEVRLHLARLAAQQRVVQDAGSSTNGPTSEVRALAAAAGDSQDPAALRATLSRSADVLEAFQDREACSEILQEIAEYGQDNGVFEGFEPAYLVLDQEGGESWVDVHDKDGNVLAREVVVMGWMRRGEVPVEMRPDPATMPASIGANLKYNRREYMVIDAAKVTAHDFVADLRTSAARVTGSAQAVCPGCSSDSPRVRLTSWEHPTSPCSDPWHGLAGTPVVH
jgi:hypothetical protein